MNLSKLSIYSALIAGMAAFSACEEDTTTIGSVISSGEVEITIDTIPYNLNAKALKIDNFDSKTGNLMIGAIQVENYGNLNCSFITKLMCAANLQIPDSIFDLDNFTNRVDSCKLIMGAKRSEIIGDSLAPQKLSVFKLTKELPVSLDINNTFNPDGYYDPANPFATKSYTVSGIAEKDSAFYSNTFVDITVDLPVDFGKDVFRQYKENPQLFEWPQTMAKDYLHGLYVTPSFGNGCVANITSVYVGIYYYTLKKEIKIEESDTITTIKHVSNLAVPFTVSPEVLSSNNISYSPSENIIEKNESEGGDGEVVITTPGGYLAEFVFPANDLLDRYARKNIHLSTVNDLVLYIPAESFGDEAAIGVAENLLLIKSSDYESFFAENKVPDNLTSFTGVYDSTNGRYYFSSMREYFINLLKKDSITEEDMNFTLVPVEIETETSNSYYNQSSYVTKCFPLTSKPTMTLLKTNESQIVFSFSTQMID